MPSSEVKNHAYSPDVIEQFRVRNHAEHGQVKLVRQQQIIQLFVYLSADALG